MCEHTHAIWRTQRKYNVFLVWTCCHYHNALNLRRKAASTSTQILNEFLFSRCRLLRVTRTVHKHIYYTEQNGKNGIEVLKDDDVHVRWYSSNTFNVSLKNSLCVVLIFNVWPENDEYADRKLLFIIFLIFTQQLFGAFFSLLYRLRLFKFTHIESIHMKVKWK